jgi:hypothetical protein
MRAEKASAAGHENAFLKMHTGIRSSYVAA